MEQNTVTIVIDDDSDIEIDESSSKHLHEHDNNLKLKNLISKLDLNTELIHVQSNLPIRICKAAARYLNLPETHIIMVK